ncbi:MAG TPA: DUF1778 domain-containing protein [Burkholderiaceae bacterium]|nr:DUF1778 domain-containing protein [Burkholderiaceae bacterium]
MNATERLEVRLPPDEKGLLVRAAEIEGVKLSQFVLAPALRHARKVIAEAEATTITTSGPGYQKILDTLAHPPQPTKALLQAMQRYDEAGIQWR